MSAKIEPVYNGMAHAGKDVTMKYKIHVTAGIFLLAGCLFSGCGSREKQQEELLLLPVGEEDCIEAGKETTVREQTEEEDLKNTTVEETYVVHICGAVQNPGIYVLEAGSRIYQAIEKAGGFCEEADQDYLNQADRLFDGMKLYVPTKEETDLAGSAEKWQGVSGAALQTESTLVNINTAGEELLCTLSGVGSTRAKSIIAYREKNGAFQKIEDIMKVDGIKDGLFQKIKDSITV